MSECSAVFSVRRSYPCPGAVQILIVVAIARYISVSVYVYMCCNVYTYACGICGCNMLYKNITSMTKGNGRRRIRISSSHLTILPLLPTLPLALPGGGRGGNAQSGGGAGGGPFTSVGILRRLMTDLLISCCFTLCKLGDNRDVELGGVDA